MCPGTPLWKQWDELQNVLEARGLGHLVGKDLSYSPISETGMEPRAHPS